MSGGVHRRFAPLFVYFFLSYRDDETTVDTTEGSTIKLKKNAKAYPHQQKVRLYQRK